MLGAGSAGVGISNQLVDAMVKEGLSEGAARDRFFLVDINGLIHEGRTDVEPYVRPLSQSLAAISEWPRRPGDHYTFEDTILNAKPTILVGATGQGGVFTERIIREMSTFTKRPIIFPLSNPTSRCEAQPADLIEWTNGQALIATGSPFPPVEYGKRTFPIAQCNNSYIFPAIGLAIRAVNANRVTDEMFMAAAIALKETSPALLQDSTAPLLPSVDNARQTAQHIAVAVASTAIEQGLTSLTSTTDVATRVSNAVWHPEYKSYTRKPQC